LGNKELKSPNKKPLKQKSHTNACKFQRMREIFTINYQKQDKKLQKMANNWLFILGTGFAYVHADN